MFRSHLVTLTSGHMTHGWSAWRITQAISYDRTNHLYAIQLLSQVQSATRCSHKTSGRPDQLEETASRLQNPMALPEITCDQVPSDIRQVIFALSEMVCQRLPPEIRDLVYGFILDDSTLRRVHDCAFPYGNRGLQPIAITHDLDLKYWPVFLVPGAVKETFRTELVEYFRKVDRFLYIEHGHVLESLLAKDLLRTNIRHADRVLHFLGIRASFPSTTNGIWDPEVLLSTMSPIMQGQQQLANNFTLKFDIDVMNYWPEHLSDPFHTIHMSLMLQKWALSLRKSYPMLRKIKEVIEKEGTARKMNIIISMQPMGPHGGPRSIIRLQEKMLEFDGDGWRDFIVPLLKKEHGIK